MTNATSSKISHGIWKFFSTIGVLSAFLCLTAVAQESFVETADHQYGELVVKLRDRNSQLFVHDYSQILSHLETTFGAGAVLSIRPFLTDPSMQVIRLIQDKDLPSAMEQIRKNSSVEIVEPNYLYTTLENGIPSDPDFNQSWSLRNTGQTDRDGSVGRPGSDIQIVPLWQEGFRGLKKTLVGIIDSGLDWDHPDLRGNLYTNPGEIDGDGKDNDGNGFIDDIHGWNFGNNTNNNRDLRGHGTHCAGIIGAQGNNGAGITGINWAVSLMPIKFIGETAQGNLQAAIDAIHYAIKMKVSILSNSWGNHRRSELLLSTLQEAEKAGILFIAAAGNSRTDNAVDPIYPASYPVKNIVSVAATDNKDHLGVYSSYGETTVHVAAPGTNIYSTFKGGEYKVMSGTSMAAPHVTGIAALLLSIHPELTFSEIKERLIQTSDPVPLLRHRSQSGGRVNAYNAVHGIIPIETKPSPSSWVSENVKVESTHPYEDKANRYFDISHKDAQYLRVHFTQIDFQSNVDTLLIEGAHGEILQDLTGKREDFMSDFIPGDHLRLHLTSDRVANGFGFSIDRIEYVPKN